MTNALNNNSYQEFWANKLRKECQNGSLPNQLLISGASCEDLTDFSQKLVGCLLCANHNWTDCICSVHQRLLKSVFYDQLIIGDFNSQIKKEPILSLINQFSYSGLENNNIKVYVINGAELLTTAAANTLLKFLEEPYKNIYAVLLSNNPQLVLPTIISRCIEINLINNQNQLQMGTESENLTIIREYCENLIHNHHLANRLLLFSLTKWDKQALTVFFTDFLNYLQQNPVQYQTYYFKLLIGLDNAFKQLKYNANKYLMLEMFNCLVLND